MWLWITSLVRLRLVCLHYALLWVKDECVQNMCVFSSVATTITFFPIYIRFSLMLKKNYH